MPWYLASLQHDGTPYFGLYNGAAIFSEAAEFVPLHDEAFALHPEGLLVMVPCFYFFIFGALTVEVFCPWWARVFYGVLHSAIFCHWWTRAFVMVLCDAKTAVGEVFCTRCVRIFYHHCARVFGSCAAWQDAPSSGGLSPHVAEVFVLSLCNGLYSTF